MSTAVGMSVTSGAALSDMVHLRQSIATILFTPVGSRVMRRSFGSLLPELIDQPDNPTTRVRLFAAVAGALMRWDLGCASAACSSPAAPPRAQRSSCSRAPTCRRQAPSSCLRFA
jgi:uncharacterized protein